MCMLIGWRCLTKVYRKNVSERGQESREEDWSEYLKKKVNLARLPPPLPALYAHAHK